MIKNIIGELKKELMCLTDDEKIEYINLITEELNDVCPFNEPIAKVKWVKQENVKANEYNPNKVATPEMNVLYESVKLDGYTQPIVAYDLGNGDYEIVDGFHRNRVGREHEDIKERLRGYFILLLL